MMVSQTKALNITFRIRYYSELSYVIYGEFEPMEFFISLFFLSICKVVFYFCILSQKKLIFLVTPI